MPHDLDALRRSLVDYGATKSSHLDGDLLAHMTNVYRLLDRMGQSEHLMLAGLYHGIYGTHALHSTDVFSLPQSQRGTIRTLIGDQAERLVFIFCVMTYESLGKSVRNIMKPNGAPAMWNRCTNETLPVSQDEFRDLLWLKLADLLTHVPRLTPEDKRLAVMEYGTFWQLVAEYLGPSAAEAWNDVFRDEALAIRTPNSKRAVAH
jgi:hypothetical protein